ncbi:MAG: polysaccharide lyase family 8 super-sandwich domain-containing protein [Bacteroidales bacterium]|nr:polysaccharide lyase family 8 super-sandwich domain-containing protein [Bacteroidales bacterium]
MRTIRFIILLLSVSSLAWSNDIRKVKEQYIRQILSEQKSISVIIDSLTSIPKEEIVADQVVTELMQLYPSKDLFISGLLSRIQADGSWSDINYHATNRSRWFTQQHVENMLSLAKVYRTKESKYEGAEEIEKALHITLAFWFRENPQSPNWWHNQIGIPKLLGAVLLLFEDQLTSDEKEEGIKIMKNSQIKFTGQNKVWLAGNTLIRALLENDSELLQIARNAIASEIRDDQFEGIKADHSFHQHGAQQQFGNYGAAFITSMSSWAQVFYGTSVAFDQQQLDILSHLINEGYHRILWKGYMDVNALGRQFFVQAERHKALAVILSANALAEIDKKNSLQYKALVYNNVLQHTTSDNQLGLYHFWQSDYTIQRRPQWMASVKMSSLRVTGGESGNGDNLKGYYLADGASYLYQNGDEYNNIFPCWDWRKLPGVTAYETNLPLKLLDWSSYKNNSRFVGNVNDGHTGVTAMDLNRDGLTARKAWIFTDDYIICLGAGIKADSGCVVTTSVEQRLQKGHLLQWKNKAWSQISDHQMVNVSGGRFFHDKTGYIFLQADQVKACTEKRTGKWGEVMDLYPDSMMDTCDIFSLWVDHGPDPKNATYQYVLVPATNKETVQHFDTKAITVLRNTKNLQVVALPASNNFYIISYSPSIIKLNARIHFRTLNAGIFFVKIRDGRMDITASDPTQTLESMELEVNHIRHRMILPSGDRKGTSVTISIHL